MLSFFRKMKADACIFVCFDLNLIGQTRLASKKFFKDKRNNFSLMLCLKHTKISKKHHYYIYISGIIKGHIIMQALRPVGPRVEILYYIWALGLNYFTAYRQ